MKLFVDDQRNPPLGADWKKTNSIVEAQRIIWRMRPLEVLVLDHDTAFCHDREGVSNAESFAAIVYMLVAMKPKDRPEKTYLISANEYAREVMWEELTKAGLSAYPVDYASFLMMWKRGEV